MPLSQSIPSKLNLNPTVSIGSNSNLSWPPNGKWSHNHYNNIYITAVLYSGPVVIDGEESDFAALSFASPIECKSFTAGLAQVAYYIQ
tara:strand:- start:189 stop:452 length:264 start_codon:yes stop_codon:yes gene_type:complete